MAKVKLSPPWALFYRKIQAMFGQDPEIHIVYDEEAEIVKLYVEDPEKAEALAKLLPEKKMFGRVGLDIQVIPADGKKLSTTLAEDEINAAIFNKAFKGNPALSYARTFKNIFQFEATYVVFVPAVVQYFADDISDINGIQSTLYEFIAREIFADIPVYFNTDIIK